MQEHTQDWSIKKMAKVLNVSRSGYYCFLKAKPSKRAQSNELLKEQIVTAHQASRETYGSPRITACLREQGETCSRKRVARLMRQHGIVAKMRRRFKVTTQVNAKAEPAPNKLQQDFTATAPNQRWVVDISVPQQAA